MQGRLGSGGESFVRIQANVPYAALRFVSERRTQRHATEGSLSLPKRAFALGLGREGGGFLAPGPAEPSDGNISCVSRLGD